MEYVFYNASTDELIAVDEYEAFIVLHILQYHESVSDTPYHTIYLGVL